MNEPTIRQVGNCETGEITYEEITGKELIAVNFAARKADEHISQREAKASRRDDARNVLLEFAKSDDLRFQMIAQAVCDYLGIESDEKDIQA